MPQSDTAITLLTLLIGLLAAFGIAYWAFRARADRSADVGLYLLFGIPGALLLIAGAALLVGGDRGLGPLSFALGLGLGLPLLAPLRRVLARVTPLDPDSPVDMTGLVPVLTIVFLQAALLLVSPGAEEPPDPSAIPAISYLDLAAQGLAFLAIAYVAVGWPVPRYDRERDVPTVRSLGEATARLGIVVPDLRTVAVGVGAVVPCFVALAIVGAIGSQLQPGMDRGVTDVVDRMTGGVQTIPGAVALGLSAGIGEEAIVRGALQPRLGIGLTSLAFALLHGGQYGLNLSIVGLLLVSIVLGLVRKHVNTTAAIITHALFNAIQVAALAML